MSKLLSSGQVAELLGVSRQRVAWLRATGKIAATRVRTGWVYRLPDVLAYKAQRDAWLAKRSKGVAGDGGGDSNPD
ncbi:MAG: helix-turn-helix domain-containing protein [Armatimonadota bacterium]